MQVGHAYASTTAIYTGVSDEYRNRLLQTVADKSATPTCGRTSNDQEDGYPLEPAAAHGRPGTCSRPPTWSPPLAERGVHLSREQVFRLVTQPPQRLSMDTLAALCDILDCTPNDLIEVETVNTQVPKTAGEKAPAPPAPGEPRSGGRSHERPRTGQMPRSGGTPKARIRAVLITVVPAPL